MSVITHDIDPDGDLVVVLKQPNTKNVIPEVSLRQETKLGKNAPTFAPDTTDVRTPSMPSGLPNNASIAGESDEIRFRVSSRHLKLASVQFRTMLSPPWTESQAVNTQSDSTDADTEDLSPSSSPAEETDSPGSPVTSSIDPSPSSPSASRVPLKEIIVTEWHADALLTVFNVIHGKGSNVPRTVSVEYFAQVAIIVDFYNCAEALSVIADLWYYLKNKRTEKYGKEAIMWLSISLVFSWSDVFRVVARMIMEGGEGPINVTTLDLPYLNVLDRLDVRRKNAIYELTNLLKVVEGQLRNGKRGCNTTCRYVMIGSLVVEKQNNDDLCLRGHVDDKAVSLSKVIAAIKDFTPAEWYDSSGCAHPCSARSLILPTVRQVERELLSFRLENFKSKA